MGVLNGRVAIVTGGASGIGRATALLFSSEGAAVAIGDLQDASAVAEEIARRGGEGFSLAVDVSREAQVQQLIECAEGHYGRVDLLVAAAGIGGGSATTAEYAEEDFDRVMAINLKGVFLAMKHALPAMVRAGGGAIVNIASVLGMVGMARTPAYSAAKGGVVQLTRTAALEYAPQGVRVNCICPGMIDTPMARAAGDAAMQQFALWQPLGRLGHAEEVAAAALFLAADSATFVTGAVLAVDGGFTAR
jgi:NAD(P)-dependent dehydrogenase (short-subunit alcohol dehydrogenase family)